MRQILFLLVRNLNLFRKNWKNVLLCFFAIAIVFGLYAIFLRDFMIQSVSGFGLELGEVKEFTDRMMTSGLLVVVNTTTCFGIIQLCIHDLEAGILRDYMVAPIGKSQLLLGYWLTSIIVSFLYTCIAWFGIQLFLHQRYETTFTLNQIATLLLLILISSIINSELLFCMITVIKDTTTFSTFGNLYGMLAGFLAGTYLPYDLYPQRLKEILFFYPPTQLTSLIRQVSLQSFLEKQVLQSHKEQMNSIFQIYGVRLYHQGVISESRQQEIFLLASFACMLLLLGIIHRD